MTTVPRRITRFDSAPKPPIVYWSHIVRGWWPGLTRRCPTCGGRLYATPPLSDGPGGVSCSQCDREVAEVQDRPVLRRPLGPDDPKPLRGRPPKGLVP